MSTRQPVVIQNIKILITIISRNLLVLVLISKLGIFYKILRGYHADLLNYQQHAVIKIAKDTNLCQNLLIKNTLVLAYSMRYYLKLRGLGFSIKYLSKPQHILLLNIGFSRVRQIKVPENISIVKKPRKKKYIFTIISCNADLINKFTMLIRSLKKPDPYKIKGFRFIQEAITTKVGKKKK